MQLNNQFTVEEKSTEGLKIEGREITIGIIFLIIVGAIILLSKFTCPECSIVCTNVSCNSPDCKCSDVNVSCPEYPAMPNISYKVFTTCPECVTSGCNNTYLNTQCKGFDQQITLKVFNSSSSALYLNLGLVFKGNGIYEENVTGNVTYRVEING